MKPPNLGRCPITNLDVPTEDDPHIADGEVALRFDRWQGDTFCSICKAASIQLGVKSARVDGSGFFHVICFGCVRGLWEAAQ